MELIGRGREKRSSVSTKHGQERRRLSCRFSSIIERCGAYRRCERWRSRSQTPRRRTQARRFPARAKAHREARESGGPLRSRDGCCNETAAAVAKLPWLWCLLLSSSTCAPIRSHASPDSTPLHNSSPTLLAPVPLPAPQNPTGNHAATHTAARHIIPPPEAASRPRAPSSVPAAAA